MAYYDYCPFCDETSLAVIRERGLILETDNFLVFPTLGQIVEGYLLVVSKRHVICLGELQPWELVELERINLRVKDKLTAAYCQSPIFFEHGVIGQTVKHAHLHAVPVNVDLFECLERDVCSGEWATYRTISELRQLREVWRESGPYIFYQRADDVKFVFEIFKYPQYLRFMLAEAVGKPERANWRKMDRDLDEELIANAIRKLKQGL